MPYFHATRRERLPSIVEHGLGGVDVGPTSEDCPRGVYLASDPRLSIMVMLGHYLNVGAEDSRPAAEMESWVVVVVDDSRIDRSRLRPDPCVASWSGSWLYDGVIDVRSAVLLTADDVAAAERAGALPPTTATAWVGF